MSTDQLSADLDQNQLSCIQPNNQTNGTIGEKIESGTTKQDEPENWFFFKEEVLYESARIRNRS